MEQYRLDWQQLNHFCATENFHFHTTEELEPLKGIIGQDRAAKALSFGLRMNKKGYNIYISGISGTGRSSYSQSIVREFAEKMSPPLDWVYVYNFKNPDKPKALGMEAGVGKQFKKDIEGMIEQIRKEIMTAFRSNEYETKKNELIKEYQQKNQEMVKELNDKAQQYGFVFKETEHGLMTIPLVEERPMTQEEYENLSMEAIEELREKSNELSLQTFEMFNEIRELEELLRQNVKKLDEKTGYDVINYYIKKLLSRYNHREEIREYINDLEKDIVENIQRFRKTEDSQEKTAALFLRRSSEDNFQMRYKINLFVNNSEAESAPIINETNPTLYNLIGAIEYKNEMGVLKTDFSQIKPGALHMANGGFLLLHTREILMQPYAWDALKRALKTGEINIENLSQQMGLAVTSTLKPEPIPLDLKVVLIGDAYTYSLLYALDEDFKKLFKIMADFDTEMDRTDENTFKMAKFIATHCKDVGLKPFDREAVCRVIQYSSRLADHQNKLTTRFSQVVEILYESDAWAQMDNSPLVNLEHVEKAILEKIDRNSKYEEKLNELFEDGTLLMDVTGETVGQINGLVVMGTGEHSFGKPTRITVSTYRGKSGIINIEREVAKSGPIHSKGVYVLSGYLGAQYAQEQPIALTASISFEQNYSMIDGDSASSTELYGILSSIARVPIKQSIAVTGSVNQKGEIQPIGGVNEKIEGFFDVCKIMGFTGEQGVIIPRQNVKNLLLKDDVIDAVRKGTFHIYAIGHVEEGIEILTGIPAGKADETGEYPPNTINNRVVKRLKSMYEKAKEEASGGKPAQKETDEIKSSS
ncbi:Lon protease family protein [Anoxynatronum buryatiense]|uniref:endopeptidase La n=1 Tax=Anoxynatronum buryatiense TaxID=489973 RepID=A0AA46AI11_9CLOT|nr:ATP-binding protein [Anoxynatronum buryatiense]SMP45242.1 lon-related putative ATP-dependent protease [Anoxynatronum buryatiense]